MDGLMDGWMKQQTAREKGVYILFSQNSASWQQHILYVHDLLARKIIVEQQPVIWLLLSYSSFN